MNSAASSGEGDGEDGVSEENLPGCVWTERPSQHLTVDLEAPGSLDVGTQLAGVRSGIGHLQVPDEEDSLLAIRHLLVAATLRQLLVSEAPGDICVWLGHFTDELHAVCLCSLHVGQVLGEPGLLLCKQDR